MVFNIHDKLHLGKTRKLETDKDCQSKTLVQLSYTAEEFKKKPLLFGKMVHISSEVQCSAANTARKPTI